MKSNISSATRLIIICGTLCGPLTLACSESPVTIQGDAPRSTDLGLLDRPAAGDGHADSAVSVDIHIADGARPDGPQAVPGCVAQGPVLQVGPGRTYAAIGAALAVAQAGDTIMVSDGTYPESLNITKGGTAESDRLQLCAENSRGAMLQGSGRRLQVKAPWVTIQGFVIDGQWGDQDIITVDPAGDHLILRDLEVKNGARDGVDIGGGSEGGCEEILIEGCQFHHLLAGSTTDQQDAHCIVATDFQGLTIRDTEAFFCSGDSLQVGTDRDPWDGLLVEGCHFWTGPLPTDAGGFSTGEIPGENALDTKAAVHGAPWLGSFVLRDSTFSGFDPAGAYIANRAALNLKDQVTGLVERCTLHENEIAFRVRGGTGDRGGVDGLLVKNCVMYRNQFHVRVEDDAANVQWLHNTYGQLIDGDNGGLPLDSSSYGLNTYKGGGGGNEGPGWTTDNNLYLGGSLPDRANGGGDLATTDSGLFVDYAGHDYHLKTQLNAGSGVGVNVDRDRRPRSVSAPDVGAYEL